MTHLTARLCAGRRQLKRGRPEPQGVRTQSGGAHGRAAFKSFQRVQKPRPPAWQVSTRGLEFPPRHHLLRCWPGPRQILQAHLRLNSVGSASWLHSMPLDALGTWHQRAQKG